MKVRKTKRFQKVTATLLVFLTVVLFSSSAIADDTMEVTLKDSIYGGVIGALIGAAVVLVSDKPEDHLSYIPTGAGVGILVGAAYGLATSGLVQSVGEVKDGQFALGLPTIKTIKIFDENANDTEVINQVDLFKLNF